MNVGRIVGVANVGALMVLLGSLQKRAALEKMGRGWQPSANWVHKGAMPSAGFEERLQPLAKRRDSPTHSAKVSKKLIRHTGPTEIEVAID
jgi:hypothetical protein